jgi:uncharacterized protein (TIGR02266 family)
MASAWCTVCNTRHEKRGDCPGELRITEPERYGWRVLVHTGSRSEVYGVLVAPTHEHWRARILTFPNMLWCVPGDRGTVKFVGNNASEAENAAIEFIKEHCNQRGYAVLGEPAMVEAQSLDEQSEPQDAGGPEVLGRQRFLKLLSVRFGVDKPTRIGRTADLSAGGLFIITDEPLRADTKIKIRLDLEGFAVPLTGRVAWTRPKAEQGRQAGMGIQLDHAPPMYQRYVDRLRAEHSDERS